MSGFQQTAAKFLGIKLDESSTKRSVTRGESIQSTDSYVEEEPTVTQWVAEVIPSGEDVVNYIIRLFPFLTWITKYNLIWLYGDLVAGITVGCVVVPQSSEYIFA